MSEQQPWLISIERYRRTAPNPAGGGRDGRDGPIKTIILSRVAPWKLLAIAKRELDEAIAKGGEADEVTAIYWAVQVPIGELTEQELDLLRDSAGNYWRS